MKVDKALSLLSICRKAGKIDSGEFSVENAVKGRQARLVIIAHDASDNTVRKFTGMCSYRKIPTIRYGRMEELGGAIGCSQRAVVSIRDEGLSEAVLQAIQNQSER